MLLQRQVHLDFHTSPAIPGIGADFDADEMARVFAEARVQSVTVFAKCHHGHLYHDTRHPARHPHLAPNLDLMGRQIEALRRRGIAAPVYLSVMLDEFAADTHPEWVGVHPDGTRHGPRPFRPSWRGLDLSSPYQDYLVAQIEEVLAKYKPLDGLFLDICGDAISVSAWALAGMDRAGLDPESEEDRARYARQVSHAFMDRVRRLALDAHGGKDIGVWFNSRPFTLLPIERQWQSYCDIEALPTGGNGWGYTFFPITARYCRTLGLPMHGMTGRFHEGWGDFGGLKPRAALLYECAQMLSLGAACSVGDQLHPSGRVDRATYRLIGDVFRHLEACEPWCAGAKPLAEIAVLRAPGDTFAIPAGNTDEGALMLLQQLGHQFDYIAGPNQDPAFDGLGDYALIIVPENTPRLPALAGALRERVARGGAVLVCGDWCQELADLLGVADEGVAEGPPSYVRASAGFLAADDADAPADTDHVVHAPARRLRPVAPDAQVHAALVEPYFSRTWRHFCSHVQTPPLPRPGPHAAVVQRGALVGLAHGLFGAYAMHGNLPLRALLAACLERLLPAPLVRVRGPRHLEVNVHRQDLDAGRHRLVAHLLSFAMRRRTPALDIIEDEQLCADVGLSLRWDQPFAPAKAYLAPGGEAVSWRLAAGRVEVSLPRVSGHQIVVLEPAASV